MGVLGYLRNHRISRHLSSEQDNSRSDLVGLLDLGVPDNFELLMNLVNNIQKKMSIEFSPCNDPSVLSEDFDISELFTDLAVIYGVTLVVAECFLFAVALIFNFYESFTFRCRSICRCRHGFNDSILNS
jgi:hypothetical protein